MSYQCYTDLDAYVQSKANGFYKILQLWYSDHMVMSVRRQIKAGRESVSFLRLLREMASAPQAITRSRYEAAFDDKMKANSIFDKFAGSGNGSLDKMRIEVDIQGIQEVSSNIEAFADRFVAHLDGRGLPTDRMPSYRELEEALLRLEQLREKYAELFYVAQSTTNIITFRSPRFNIEIESFVKKAAKRLS